MKHLQAETIVKHTGQAAAELDALLFEVKSAPNNF
jgi:hypothetical protein